MSLCSLLQRPLIYHVGLVVLHRHAGLVPAISPRIKLPDLVKGFSRPARWGGSGSAGGDVGAAVRVLNITLGAFRVRAVKTVAPALGPGGAPALALVLAAVSAVVAADLSVVAIIAPDRPVVADAVADEVFPETHPVALGQQRAVDLPAGIVVFVVVLFSLLLAVVKEAAHEVDAALTGKVPTQTLLTKGINDVCTSGCTRDIEEVELRVVY
mmetsp:Transcript_2142/g.3953  ORF Transcript_2142/g.3953 Transcript_2142/m.3953 type:complete len:212 (-) Transcript_2142:220-855(-)